MARRIIRRLPPNDEFLKLFPPEPERELRNYVTPIDKNHFVGGKKLFYFLIDASGSAIYLYEEFLYFLNVFAIRALEEFSRNYSSIIRLGGALFSNEIVPIWNRFVTLEEAAASPLKINAFWQKKLHGETALFASILDGLSETGRAINILNQERTSSPVEARFIVLSDIDNNMSPLDPEEVKRITGTILNPQLVRTILCCTKMDERISDEDAEIFQNRIGFSERLTIDFSSDSENPTKKWRPLLRKIGF